mgnify:CR=1 FL=1
MGIFILFLFVGLDPCLEFLENFVETLLLTGGRRLVGLCRAEFIAQFRGKIEKIAGLFLFAAAYGLAWVMR